MLDQQDVLEAVSAVTGIPCSTIYKWCRKEKAMLELYDDKKARRLKQFGGGRPPLFPKAEAAASQSARNLRAAGMIVPKSLFLNKLKEEAEKENPDAARNASFGPDYLSSVLARCSLALRLPSCTKAMSLENGVLTCRGFFQWLRLLICDELPEGKQSVAPLDLTYGRFPLDLRGNKDEVSVSHIMPSITGTNFAFRCPCLLERRRVQ